MRCQPCAWAPDPSPRQPAALCCDCCIWSEPGRLPFAGFVGKVTTGVGGSCQAPGAPWAACSDVPSRATELRVPTICASGWRGGKRASMGEEPYRKNPRYKMWETEMVLNVFCSGHWYPCSSLLTVNASSGNCCGHSWLCCLWHKSQPGTRALARQFHTGHSTTLLICFYGQGRWTQTLNCQVPFRMQNATLKKAKGKQFREKKRMEISIIRQHWQKTNPGSRLLCTALFMPMLVAAPVGIRSTTNCLFPWIQRALIATDHADRAHCLHLNGNRG